VSSWFTLHFFAFPAPLREILRHLSRRIVGQADYDFWRMHFGETIGSGAAASANAAVPEPTAVALLLLAAAVAMLRRQRSRVSPKLQEH
jgi:hypothetical protein